MDTYQKRTYLVYSRGLSPEDLTLGSLHLDPANPLDGEQKRFECHLEQTKLRTLTKESKPEEPCFLDLVVSRQWLINSGLFALLKGKLGAGGSQRVTIHGKSGRRLRIEKPETFLQDVILTSEEARAWLADKLSVSRTVYHLSQIGLKKQPRLWMVTGIQYMTDAVVFSGDAQHQMASASAKIPIPEPISAAVTSLGGGEGVSGGFDVGQASGSRMAYGHKDERVWAAQFTPLAVRFIPAPASSIELPSRISLRDVVDIKSGGVRAGSQPVDFTLSGESAEVYGVEDNATELNGEELLKEMQDVDWGLLNACLASSC